MSKNYIKILRELVKIRRIYYFLLILLIFVFTTYICVQTLITSSKDLSNLNYIKGPITDFRFIKHKYHGRYYREKFENVLVITIEGSTDEFGFTESRNDPYKSIWEVVSPGRVAEIYYDQNDERIENSVTRHIYDLNISGIHLIDIKVKKRSDRILSIILFLISAGLLIFIIKIIKRIRKNRLFSE